ncbi:MAG: DNA-3-methyladenine glycosylase family protein [Acidimicrobiales bacterium]
MSASGSLTAAYQPPADLGSLFAFFALRAIPGVEDAHWSAPDGAGHYRRTVRLTHGEGIIELRGRHQQLFIATVLTDQRDHPEAVVLARRLFDLDADPVAVDGVLGGDEALAPLVRARPGLRVPGLANLHEALVRAIIGQQISVAAARTVTARLAATVGASLGFEDPAGTLNRHFPHAAALAGLDAASLPMPRSRGRALVAAAAALAGQQLPLPVPPADLPAARRQLLALTGVGPWTADYVLLRAGGDRDVFLAGDLAIRSALTRLGLPADARGAAAHATRWRPWRSYATLHLWRSLADPGPGGDHPT